MGTDKDIHAHELIKLNDKMGIDAKVERNKVSNANTIRANLALGDIGNFIKQDCGIGGMQELTYVGSAAVHIYQSEALGLFHFVAQVDPLGKTPQFTASEAFTEMGKQMESFYGKDIKQRRRSGL